MIGQASINLGDGAGNLGQNVFSDNGNGGVTFALHNNTPNTLMAMNNCWDEANATNTLADAEAVTVHQNDIASLGLVTFNPVNCDFLSVELLSTDAIAIYPNPTDGRLYLSNNNSFEQLKVYSLDGKLVVQKNLQPGMNEIHFTLNSDIYVLELNGSNPRTIKKLVIN